MNKLKELCDAITAYEREQLNNGWHINYYDKWEGVTFGEIISDCEKYGVNENSYSLKNEIANRVATYYTFSNGEEAERENLRALSDALKIIDSHLHTDIHDSEFGGKTADEIADEWEEQERWEREEEERQECIDFCAKILYNDGVFETLDEAYEVAEMVY